MPQCRICMMTLTFNLTTCYGIVPENVIFKTEVLNSGIYLGNYGATLLQFDLIDLLLNERF